MSASLVVLPAVERLSPRCIRILGGNPGKFTLQGTNTYLLGTGRRRLLIDTGEGRKAWIDSVKATLEQENATLEATLITHWHHDHVGGIKDLLSLYPKTPIYKYNADPGQVDISHEQQFSVEGASLTAIYTPGHTDDHLVFVLDEEDAMFTADNVLGHGTSVFEDLKTYMNSLDRMKPLFKGRAYPGHGAHIEDGPAKIAEYIAHRRQREDQVLHTLSLLPGGDGSAQTVGTSASWGVMELVQTIYKDVPSDLHLAAAGGVLKILQKLSGEGRVSQTGDKWVLVASRGPSL